MQFLANAGIHVPPEVDNGAVEELPLHNPLVAVENAEAWWVVVDENPEDWLVRFEKSETFEAGEWAFNMVRTFNSRLDAAEERTDRGEPGSSD